MAITLLAGLCTGIGSFISLFTATTNKKFLSLALGFSAGVMIYVSMIDIFPKAKDALISATNAQTGYLLTTFGFFAGIALIALIDRFIPEIKNPHEFQEIDSSHHPSPLQNSSKLLRMGTLSALAIAIHNFPEGMATFLALYKDPSIGIPIAVAIAIHNIPEGISVSVPIYYATGSRMKAFWYSFLSGVSEPIGALVGFFIFLQFMSDIFFGVIFASVAGIMVFISLDQLLPAAREYGEHHLSVYGLISGMGVMALSLILFS